MDRALFLAARGRGRTSPNPMVGAVVVSPDGVIVGQGFHERAGKPHAEVQALGMAGARARGARRCTAPSSRAAIRDAPVPCAPRIVEAGIARVVAATIDPNPRRRWPRLQLSARAGCGRRGRPPPVGGRSPEPAVFHADARGPAVRDSEGGDQPRRLHRARRRANGPSSPQRRRIGTRTACGPRSTRSASGSERFSATIRS